MKIALDLSQISSEKTGIEYYTYELTKALTDSGEDHVFYLFTNNEKYVSDFKDGKNIKKIVLKAKRPSVIWFIRATFYLYLYRIDYLISPSNFVLNLLFRRTIQFVHDLAPIRYPQFWDKKAAYSFKKQLKWAIQYSKFIFTISDSTKNDIKLYYPGAESKTYNVGIGLHSWVDRQIGETEKNDVVKKYDLPNKFFLSVSTLQPRKNYENMIKGFAKFLETNPDFSYVIAGKKGWHYESIFKLVEELKIKNSVKFLDYLPEEDLPAMYDLCQSVLYCSIFEGFGLPAIEAIARKKTVIVSDIPVFRESVDDMALFADPNDPIDICNKMKESLNYKVDEQSIETVHKNYSWKGVAEKIFNIIGGE